MKPDRIIEGPPPDDMATKPGSVVVVDDLQGSHVTVLSEWFTKKSHHQDTSIIYLVQNVFDKTPVHRTISLNANYLVLFKNPRDSSQIVHLSKQVFPGRSKVMIDAYRQITRTRAHSYLLVDFKQDTPNLFRLRSSLFPEEAVVYVDENDIEAEPWNV